jgi:hypothetical protein
MTIGFQEVIYGFINEFGLYDKIENDNKKV